MDVPIANKAIDSRSRSLRVRVACKLHIKVDNLVNCDFSFSAMLSMGFGGNGFTSLNFASQLFDFQCYLRGPDQFLRKFERAEAGGPSPPSLVHSCNGSLKSPHQLSVEGVLFSGLTMFGRGAC